MIQIISRLTMMMRWMSPKLSDLTRTCVGPRVACTVTSHSRLKVIGRIIYRSRLLLVNPCHVVLKISDSGQEISS